MDLYSSKLWQNSVILKHNKGVAFLTCLDGYLFSVLLALCSLLNVVIIQLQTVAKRVSVCVHNLLSVFNTF